MRASTTSGREAQAGALVRRALDCIHAGQFGEALQAADFAVRLAPRNPNAHSYRGSALLELNRTADALHAYQQVVRLAPGAAVAHYNCGNALHQLGRLDDAAAALRRALSLQPGYSDAHTVLGIILRARGDFEGAMRHFEQAIAINPQAADAHYNKAISCLSAGLLREGWEAYEWRLRWIVTIRQGQSRAIDRVAPDWDGRPLDKPLLVLPEQGLGDQIFFAGMLGDLQQVVEQVTVCVEPRLVPLLARSFPHVAFKAPSEIDEARACASGEYGAQIHLGSLGRFFRHDAGSMQRVTTTYLQADPARIASLRERLARPGQLVCGLSWNSKNAASGTDKSLRLDALAPLLSLPQASFVDLQYGDTGDERSQLQAAHGLSVQKLDDIDNRNDIDGLAALISACDLVVTISNTTAHLAAALGKPTIILLTSSPKLLWYWHRDRNDSPWYPSAVLLRQSRMNDWTDVIDVARQAVAMFAQERQP
jgi:tetratricopeptide (TPR) repeat protein